MSYLAPYRLSDTADVLPSGEFLLPICITPERFERFFAALVQGGWTMYGEEIGDHNIDVLRALAFVNDPQNAACGMPSDGGDLPIVETVIREVVRTLYVNNPDLILDLVEEDNMSQFRPTYQKFNGVWYAGFPCGDCGGLEWVALGAGAALSPDGVPQSQIDAPTGITVAPTTPLDGNGSLTAVGTCYTDKAANIMIGRQIDYINGVFGWTNLGVASLAGVAFDTAQLGNAILNNEFAIADALDADGLTAEDVVTTLQSAEWNTRLEGAIASNEAFG
ncbi:MAG: hypothetical protein AAF125_18425, partial [Chloroflexota bacterium]